jgi:uncharacterized protein (DUF1800 family)
VKRSPLPHLRQRCLAAALCLSVSAALAAVPLGYSQAKDAAPSELREDARILHALSRFTFGPRPGDLEAVRAIGLDRWFELQLHPAEIGNTDLDARLSAYPAMQSTTADLIRRFPSNAMIRQALNGKIDVPNHGIQRSIYQNAIYRLNQKRQQKQEAALPVAVNASAESSRPAPELTASFDDVSDEGTAPAAPGTESVPDLLALSPERRIQQLAGMTPAEAGAFFASLTGSQRSSLLSGMSPELKETAGALQNPERTIIEELIAQRLTRDIYSNAQLQEVMADFWFNHFNVFLRKNPATPYYLVSYERDAIRPHALGKFEDLLNSVAHSPAMLLYLDNAGSTGPDSAAAQRARLNHGQNPTAQQNRQGLNENYARELMELHTLGVNGGYTQSDVMQVARILTGWTVDRPQHGGEFRFDAHRHEPGAKRVMGHTFRENGEREGRDLLHFLATRPATARFIARKLAVRFVSDEPPANLINRLAATYMSSGGDIAAILKAIFDSPEFWNASTRHAKIKTPLEFVVSAARAGNADIANLRPLANALRQMGMPLYGAVPPTGYKWDAADWVSTGALVNRMNFALAFAANRLPGISPNWKTFDDANPQAEELRLESAIVPGGVSESTRAAVLQQFEAQHVNTKQDQLLAGLLLGSPEFQRR